MMTPFDLNNEMVLMRKDIKRAKLWAISRLVRHARNLRNKKGDEAKRAKNMRRAERLVEEIGLIKELKPDAIFKSLLSFDSYPERFTNGTIPLEKRAIIRVGSANFIQTRLHELKLKVEEFQSHHGGKPLPESFSKAISSQGDGTAVGEMNEQMSLLGEENLPITVGNAVNDKERLAHPENNETGILAHPDSNETERLDHPDSNEPERLYHPDNNKIERLAHPYNNKTEKLSHPSQKIKIVAREAPFCDHEKLHARNIHGLAEQKENFHDDCSSPDIDPQDLTKVHCLDSDRLNVEERIVGMSEDGYEIVIPPMQLHHNAYEISKKKNFDPFKAGGTDDITELLPNIGAHFDSDHGSNSGLDIENLMTSCKSVKQEKVDEGDSGREDPFFVSAEGASTNKIRRRQMGRENAVRLEDESQSQVKSCFLESLASVSHQRTKGKNRMSQRARKKLASKKMHDEICDKGTVKETSVPRKKTVRSGDNASKKSGEPQPLHPSWEASRKRKQAQSAVNQFKGKRVCFEDSD